jgi:hypothetical protein
MTLNDLCVHFDIFHPLVQMQLLDSPTRQGHLETTSGNKYIYVNVYSYPFRTAQLSLTDSSFHFDFLSPIGAGAPSGLFDRAMGLGSDTGKLKYVCKRVILPVKSLQIPLIGRCFHFVFFSPIASGWLQVDSRKSPTAKRTWERILESIICM